MWILSWRGICLWLLLALVEKLNMAIDSVIRNFVWLKDNTICNFDPILLKCGLYNHCAHRHDEFEFQNCSWILKWFSGPWLGKICDMHVCPPSWFFFWLLILYLVSLSRYDLTWCVKTKVSTNVIHNVSTTIKSKVGGDAGTEDQLAYFCSSNSGCLLIWNRWARVRNWCPTSRCGLYVA